MVNVASRLPAARLLPLLALTTCSRPSAPAPAPAAPAQAAAPARAPAAAPAPASTARVVAAPPGAPRFAITVGDEGYTPAEVTVDRSKPFTLVFTRKSDKTCATDVLVPAAGVNKPLPLGQPVEVSLAVDEDTSFGCAMGLMIHGTIKVK